MKEDLYIEILKIVQRTPIRQCVRKLTQMYPDVPKLTLGSIVGQDYQQKMKKTHYKHSSPNVMAEYYSRYEQSLQRSEKRGILLRLSKELQLSPSLLARLVLEHWLRTNKKEGDIVNRSTISKLMKNTALIEDGVLAYEIFLCNFSDDHYSPISDSVKHSIGHEYEFKLKHELQKLNIAFEDEDQLRIKGYDKTPDVKLEVPIAVDGNVINWIESKASFGDRENHKMYLKEQFWSYWNRFGPGLVIYWFGFIEELDEHRDKGILLLDYFPTTITMMDPLSISSMNR